MVLRTEIRNFLESHRVVNLSYSNDRPECCALWFASDKALNIIYLSSINTTHGNTLINGGEVAFTINRDSQSWQTIQGIQGRGTVKQTEENESWEVYTTKFPFIKEQFTVLEEALNKTKMWIIQPTWLRFIDNTKGFGHKEELVF